MHQLLFHQNTSDSTPVTSYKNQQPPLGFSSPLPPSGRSHPINELWYFEKF
jgi:hypothetical protein